MNKALNKQLKNKQFKFAADLRIATGQILPFDRDSYNSCCLHAEDTFQWRSFKFYWPKSYAEEDSRNLLEEFSIGYSELRALLLECNRRCGRCSQLLTQSINTELNSEYFLGYRIKNNFRNHNELIEQANVLQVNSLYVDDVGFLDIVEKKSFYAVSELVTNEQSAFVYQRFSLKSGESFLNIDNSGVEDGIVFSIQDGKLFEVEPHKFCANCETYFTELGSIDCLLEYSRDDFPSFKEHTKAWDFLELCQIFLSDKVNTKCMRANLSLDGYYLLSIVSRLIFGSENVYYNVRYPVLNEFSASVRKVIKGHLDKYSFSSRARFPTNLTGGEIDYFEVDQAMEVQRFNWKELKYAKFEEALSPLFITHSAPTLFEYEQFNKLINGLPEHRLFEIDGLSEFEKSSVNTNSIIYSYLNLGKYFHELYHKHPLSKARGLSIKDFTVSHARLLAESGSGFGDISWRGIAFPSLLFTNIEVIKAQLGGLLPGAFRELELLCDFGLGSLELGRNLSSLSPTERIKLKLIKHDRILKSEREILVLSGVGSLLFSVSGKLKIIEFLSKIARRGPKIFIVFSGLDELVPLDK